MADKKVNQLPAKILPILNTDLFIVADPATGVASHVNYQALYNQIVTTLIPTGLKVYYVDGNNTVSGDGSITNPFKTLEQAYNLILGTGTPDNPQIQNVAVSVASFSYSTILNIYLKNVTWHFQTGTTVTFTGTGYFVDTTALNNCNGYFKITGGLFLIVTQGGFVNNQGVSYSQTQQKSIYIEMYGVRGQTPLGTGTNPTLDKPLFRLAKTASGGGYSVPSIYLKFDGVITSRYQTVVYMTGSVPMTITGGGTINYGNDYSSGSSTGGDVQGCIIRYENNETGTRRYVGQLICSEVNFSFGQNIDKAIHIEGAISGGYIRNCSCLPGYGSAVAKRFLEIGDIEAIPYSVGDPASVFILMNVRMDTGLSFNQVDIIRWIGTTAGMNVLNMLHCYLYTGTFVNNNVNVSASIGTCINFINNKLNLRNVPVFVDNASAIFTLDVGDVYRTPTGELRIVI